MILLLSSNKKCPRPGIFDSQRTLIYIYVFAVTYSCRLYI